MNEPTLTLTMRATPVGLSILIFNTTRNSSFCLQREGGHLPGEVENSVEQQVGIFCRDPSRETASSPGSGYSLGDYAPLSTLIPKFGKLTATTKSPPRKHKRLVGRPGKVMEEAHFKGFQ